ncbi:MAG: hypothetical protein EB078_11985 [Proteobacteria bacterium]|nr:hypothetical protein [Pseudomonadota bacterium]NDD05618.1 hypothetical protein [Pseudomonadota bacterium]NDG27150.1 hypothetical protein [Pseudomonadota bacterium]
MKLVQLATYPLENVFLLVDTHKVVFTAPSRSLRQVMAVYSGTKSEKEAREFIYEGIKCLTEKHFCGSQIQWGDLVVDKYGLMFDGRPWFIKFAIVDGELEEISFHPPEKELKTLSGLVIPKE